METVILTPVELFVLARIERAKYMDYAYIRAMPGIEKDFVRHEQEALESLEKKELILLDFDGEVELDEDVKAIMEPVFYGEQESRLDREGMPSLRFHIHEGKIIMAEMDDGVIKFCSVTDDDIFDLLLSGDVEIHVSDVNTGKRSAVFQSKELEKPETRNLAVHLLKGE